MQITVMTTTIVSQTYTGVNGLIYVIYIRQKHIVYGIVLIIFSRHIFTTRLLISLNFQVVTDYNLSTYLEFFFYFRTSVLHRIKLL